MASYNTAPIYPGTIKSATVRMSAANTARDGSGTLGTLVTAGAQGSLVTRVGVISSAAVGASTPMVARLWRVNGGTITLIDEVALATATTSNTVVGTRTVFNRTNILLAAGAAEILKVTISIAEAVDFEAEYGDY